MISAKTIKRTALAPTVLITHAGGFLAAHLAQTLLLKNCRVVVLTNSRIYKDTQFSGLLKSPKFALYECDINTGLPDTIESVDYIFHLANYDTFINLETMPDLESLLSAGIGTKNLLDLAKKSQAKFALVSPVISQIKAFNNAEVTPKEAQKYSQTLVFEYGDRYKLDARIVFMGHVYGPGMDPEKTSELGGMVSDVLEMNPLKIGGDGSRKEFFLFLNDAVAGLVKGLFSQAPGGIFTLVEEKPHTVLEVAYILRSLADGKVDIDFTDSNSEYENPSLEEISYPPAWVPRVELRDGLIKTLKSFGYRPNSKSFKAGILIEEKNKADLVNQIPDPVSSLSDFKPKTNKEFKINFIRLFFYRIERNLRVLGRRFNGGSPTVRYIKYSVTSLFMIMLLMTVFMVVPLVQSVRYGTSALNDLENYQTSISRLDSKKAQKLSENAYNNLGKLQNSLNRASPLFNLTGKSATLKSLQSFVSSAQNFSVALYSYSLASEPFSQLWEGLKPKGTPEFSLENFRQSSLYFKEAAKNLDFAKASFGKVNKKDLPSRFQEGYDKYDKALITIGENSDLLVQLALEAPKIIGLEGSKRYLFLFQNNNELRPTGGFLGSYAIVEVDKGKVTKIDIDDIYNPDGQLKLSKANIDIKPPLPLANALSEDVLYIRNANWEPGFPQSSQTITNLFQLSNNTNFDGVVAVDLYFVRDLLSVTGPLYLAAFDEEIRVDNMYERSQFHSDFDFKEGVSSKKAFMTVLSGKMLEKLFALPQEKTPALLNVLYLSLEQKHLLINLNGTYLSKYLAERGWDGSLPDVSGDYLYVVNANVGGTKSNYYVKNDMNYAVSSKTSDGLLRAELELTYENTQKDSSWPGGPYKDYVRVLVQNGSKLTGAFIMQGGTSKAGENTNVLGGSSGTDILDKVAIGKVGKFTSFEYQITVSPTEKVRLLLNYDLPTSLSAKKELNSYNLYWQKQPGTQNDGVRLMFAAPFGTRVNSMSPAGSSTDNIYEYKGILNQDTRFILRYK